MILGTIISFLLALWIIPQYLGQKRRIGFTRSLLACVFLTPLIGLIITLLSPKLDEYKKEFQVIKKEQSRIEKSIQNLIDLKQKGILTEQEYQEKINRINLEKAERKLKTLKEYKQLKSLFDSGILTEEEFENKVSTLETPKTVEVKQEITQQYDGLSIKATLLIGLLAIIGLLVFAFISKGI